MANPHESLYNLKISDSSNRYIIFIYDDVNERRYLFSHLLLLYFYIQSFKQSLVAAKTLQKTEIQETI